MWPFGCAADYDLFVSTLTELRAWAYRSTPHARSGLVQAVDFDLLDRRVLGSIFLRADDSSLPLPSQIRELRRHSGLSSGLRFHAEHDFVLVVETCPSLWK